MPQTDRTWILVADAAQARMYTAEAPGAALRAIPGLEFHNPTVHGHSRDLGTDRPGRTHESVGGAHHGLEPRVDPHREAKRDFAKQTAHFLEQAARESRYDRLVVVAPPAMLGDLRDAMGRQTQQRLTGELAKDLTKETLGAIAQHLATAGKL